MTMFHWSAQNTAVVLDHYLIPESLEILPQYPTTALLLDTHFHTEERSADPEELLSHSRRWKGPRTKGEGSHTGTQDLTLGVLLYQLLTVGSLVPREHSIDPLSGTDVCSHVHCNTLGLPRFFSLYTAVFI